MSRMLILGHSGLVGYSLFTFLSSLPHIEVFGIDRSDCDFTHVDSISYLKNTYEKLNPDTVVVLAAIKRQHSDSESTLSANNSITDNVALSLVDRRCRVVYISSCAVYGEKNNQIACTEESPCRPTSDYGRHKVYSESVYTSSINSSRLLIIRPPLIYRPYFCNSYGPSLFLNQSLANHQITVWGDGSEYREFIHTTDVAYTIYLLASLEVSTTINLVSGLSYSYSSIANFIASILPIDIHYKSRSIPIIVNHSYNPKKLCSYLPPGYQFLTPQQSILQALSQ
jgi:nucleoside-diphosphate-sugar epimerase